uniref:Uncharacterized protein n=1 Tax=Schistosoma haematobium TaxID=6185 RepID=A0A094ZIX2_SCHHA
MVQEEGIREKRSLISKAFSMPSILCVVFSCLRKARKLLLHIHRSE